MWMGIFRSVPEIENSTDKGPEEGVCLPYSRNSRDWCVQIEVTGQSSQGPEQEGFYWLLGRFKLLLCETRCHWRVSATEIHDPGLEENYSDYCIENRYIPTYLECPFGQRTFYILKFFLFFQILIQKLLLLLAFPKPYHIEVIFLFHQYSCPYVHSPIYVHFFLQTINSTTVIVASIHTVLLVIG